jgi:hypothetical protein
MATANTRPTLRKSVLLAAQYDGRAGWPVS